ncbi:MAG: hypothetical protein NTV01_04475 [Bacteroidia bacterium]|nr:hypothetical protein [Bacteroidia bacterium]
MTLEIVWSKGTDSYANKTSAGMPNRIHFAFSRILSNFTHSIE